MTNPRPFQVCVCALTRGEYKDVEPEDLRNLLIEAAPEYDVKESGKVYGDTRDEWAPFAGGKTMLDHLQEAGLDSDSVSSFFGPAARDPALLAVLINGVNLYVFDAAFLALESFSSLVGQVSVLISAKEVIQFCVVIPGHLPEELRRRLEELCEEKLPLLNIAYTSQAARGEWLVYGADRLVNYLRRVPREIAAVEPSSDRPDPESSRIAGALLEAMGFSPNMSSNPTQLARAQNPGAGTLLPL